MEIMTCDIQGVDPKSLELVISDEVQQSWVEALIRHDIY